MTPGTPTNGETAQCGCGDPIIAFNGEWYHLEPLPYHHPASPQLTFDLEEP